MIKCLGTIMNFSVISVISSVSSNVGELTWSPVYDDDPSYFLLEVWSGIWFLATIRIGFLT